MADYLATIYGTESDKVNCSFYYKIGACRHGEKCSRKHIKPTFSSTILLPNLYQNPKMSQNEQMNDKQLQESFDFFFKDIFLEFAKFGEIEELIVCENINDHLNGNVYVKYKDEDEAATAVRSLNSKWYSGKPVYCELSPVNNFAEANCRQFELDNCNRGGLCNFMHVKKPTKNLQKELNKSLRKYYLLKELKSLEEDEDKNVSWKGEEDAARVPVHG